MLGDMSLTQLVLLVLPGAILLGLTFGIIYFYSAKRLIGVHISFWSGVHSAAIGWIASALLIALVSRMLQSVNLDTKLFVLVLMVPTYLITATINGSLIRRADGAAIRFTDGAKLQIVPSALITLYLLTL